MRRPARRRCRSGGWAAPTCTSRRSASAPGPSAGGDWAVGWGSQDDSQSIAAIRHAVERGVNWIDTAAIYGLGHSEEIVRAAMKDIPSAQRPFVFTKCGLLWDENDRKAMPQNIGAPASIRAELRGLAQAPRRRAHRPLSDALAGQGRHADRGVLEDAARPQSRGQGARRRPFQPQRGAAHRGREDRPRRHAAAAVLRHPPRVRRGRAAVVRQARHRRHRLQPDAGRPADRRLHRRARQERCRPTTGARATPSSPAPS